MCLTVIKLMSVGVLWRQWFYCESWCKGLQPRGSIGQGDWRLCGSTGEAWREKGWSSSRRGITEYLRLISKLYDLCVLPRRMVPALQRGSLTAATASQKECTPWLWSRPCLQTASLSYSLRCCTPRTRGPWPDRNEDRRSDLFTCEQGSSHQSDTWHMPKHMQCSQSFPIFPVLSSMYTSLLFPQYHRMSWGNTHCKYALLTGQNAAFCKMHYVVINEAHRCVSLFFNVEIFLWKYTFSVYIIKIKCLWSV